MPPFPGSDPPQPPQPHHLRPESGYHTAVDAASRFLSYGPRSQAEVRRRLSRRFPQELVDTVKEALRHKNYLNDEEFARQWRIH